jgi:anthranilate/para-aminobenzoate synthase component II
MIYQKAALRALASTLLFARAPVNPPGMQCEQRTLVLFSPGPNTARDKELTPAHLRYFGRQMRAKKVTAAGPFEGNDGGAIIE